MKYKPSHEHQRILSRDPGKVAALPWSQGTVGGAEGHAICGGPIVIANVLGNGYPAGHGWAPDSHATAAFIVRAANCHAAMVEALSAVMRCASGELERPVTQRTPWAQTDVLVRRALHMVNATMTLDDFRNTRTHSHDLAAAISSDNWETKGKPTGFLYLGSLYIEEVRQHWPEEARKRGKWHLLIDRQEWFSDDLSELEARLYDWALMEGYFNPAPATAPEAVA